MHACIMKTSVEFEIRLPFTHPCIPKCVEDNWVYLLEFFWSYWHKIIVCSYVETVLISSKCSNLLLPQILWDPYLPPLSSSDRQSGVLALICELMDMNIYELIKGTVSQQWFTTWPSMFSTSPDWNMVGSFVKSIHTHQECTMTSFFQHHALLMHMYRP